ncbi:MAG: hypothetical protein HZB53_08950 [Chloroflexi bacterium]|nr:hypothetical protein [Chloroflexota bacterium]
MQLSLGGIQDTVLRGTLAIFLFVAFVTVLSMYLWHVLMDVAIANRNYNFPRAPKCNAEFCGLYHRVENDPLSMACLSPYGRQLFPKLSMGGDQPGCRFSIQVRETAISRMPANTYLKEFLDNKSAFNSINAWWKIIAILGGLVFFSFGLVSLVDLFNALTR